MIFMGEIEDQVLKEIEEEQSIKKENIIPISDENINKIYDNVKKLKEEEGIDLYNKVIVNDKEGQFNSLQYLSKPNRSREIYYIEQKFEVIINYERCRNISKAHGGRNIVNILQEKIKEILDKLEEGGE